MTKRVGFVMNPRGLQRGKYASEAKASMTMAELEKWMALEIAGRYHQQVHRGLHAIPTQVWDRTIKHSVGTRHTQPTYRGCQRSSLKALRTFQGNWWRSASASILRSTMP
jgi:hypothetical protein